MRYLLTIIAVLTFAGSAEAARAPLSLNAAYKAANRFMADEVEYYSDVSADPEFYEEFGPEPGIVSYELAPCERISRSHAECEATYEVSDGDYCWMAIDVRAGRRYAHAEYAGDEECDSDDPGWLVLADDGS